MSKKQLRRRIKLLEKENAWLWTLVDQEKARAYLNKVHNDRLNVSYHDVLTKSFK